MSICFCTLAIHPPYRERAKLLCRDLPDVDWVVLTDEPHDFFDLPVHAIRHTPTGPMARDYLSHLPLTGNGRGAAAYHDKRFALKEALKRAETAIYVDADSRVEKLISTPKFRTGIAVLPVVEKTVSEHLTIAGPWRLPFFMQLAVHLTGETKILNEARWCHEALIAVTKDGNESRFFDAWAKAAKFLQSRNVFSGEGGVIGFAAWMAGWHVDFQALNELGSAIDHEGGGPKVNSNYSTIRRHC